MLHASAATPRDHIPSTNGLSSLKKYWIALLVLFGVGACVFCISTIVLAVLYGIERDRPTNQQTTNTTVNNSSDVCTTLYCYRASAFLLENMNLSADPCTNWYQFACGRFVQNQVVPDTIGTQETLTPQLTKLRNNIIDILSKPPPQGIVEARPVINARRLYASCVDETAIETEDVQPVIQLVDEEFGGWPILRGSTWNNSTFNYTRLLLKLAQYNTFVFYRTETTIDEVQASIYCIRLGQSDLGLGDRDSYVAESDFTRAYRTFMRGLATALTTDTSMIEADVNDIFQFERTIAPYFWTTTEQTARVGQNIRTNIGNLSSILNINSFDFVGHLRRLYLLVNISLVDSDPVTVSELEVLRNLSLIINQTSARTLQNYMVWRFMMSHTTHMPRRFRNIIDQYDVISQTSISETTRLITCSSYVYDNMDIPVSKLYTYEIFDRNARREAGDMYSRLYVRFINTLNQSTLMDQATKTQAFAKLALTLDRTAYPAYLDSNDNTKLETDYAGYEFNSSYIRNIFILDQLNSQNRLKMLQKPMDRITWNTPNFGPLTRRGGLDYLRNNIAFTAALLQTPYFNKDAPKYLNYGAIGSYFAHAFTHVVDVRGQERDASGNNISWWSPQTLATYNQRKECFVQQYSGYRAAQVNRTLNGEFEAHENIADCHGVKDSFYEYQSWAAGNRNVDKRLPGLTQYSPEQLFFVSFASMLCTKYANATLINEATNSDYAPDEFRATGPIANSVEFDRVFGCTPGQGVSRLNKCNMW